MNSWFYVEPTSETDMTPHTVTLTENEILASYYPWWARRMMDAGHVRGIFPLACIEDWVVVHWATPVKSPPR